MITILGGSGYVGSAFRDYLTREEIDPLHSKEFSAAGIGLTEVHDAVRTSLENWKTSLP